MTKKKQSKKEELVEYPVNEQDYNAFVQTIQQIENYTLSRGKIRNDYMKSDKKLEGLIESIVEQQAMLANLMKQKSGAPNTHVLDLNKKAFVIPPGFDNERK